MVPNSLLLVSSAAVMSTGFVVVANVGRWLASASTVVVAQRRQLQIQLVRGIGRHDAAGARSC